MAPTTNLRHSFAIKVLGKLPGLFQPQRYAYYCVRCKWSFVVNDGKRGVITALDASGEALNGLEAVKRVSTFADGPCPSLKILTLAVRRPRPSIPNTSNGATINGTTHDAVPIDTRRSQHREHRRV